jgi:uncharacterized protein YhdP
MTVWDWIGAALVVIGVVEVVVFRILAPQRDNIRQRMPLLMANSAFNIVVGLALLAFL